MYACVYDLMMRSAFGAAAVWLLALIAAVLAARLVDSMSGPAASTGPGCAPRPARPSGRPGRRDDDPLARMSMTRRPCPAVADSERLGQMGLLGASARDRDPARDEEGGSPDRMA